MGEVTIQELLDRIRLGENEAAKELVRIYEDNLKRMIRVQMNRAIQSTVDASDICQEVWVDFFQRVKHESVTAEAVGALLRRMARSKSIDSTRHAAAGRRDHRRNVPVGSEPDNLPANQESPSQIAHFNEMFVRIIDMLTPEQRQIGEWRRDKMSWPEIAKRMNEDIWTVKRLFEKTVEQVIARQRLRGNSL